MAETRTQRRLAAILAADIAGFSRLIAADEAGTLAAMRDVWQRLFNPAVAGHDGRIVKMMGDGALVEFQSAVDAVECAFVFQQAMAGRNASAALRIEFRIGINLGDIVIEGEDILGDGVNVAARLEGAAPEGGVLVSDAVHAQVRGKVAVAFDDAGELGLKNIDRPVRAWRWAPGGAAARRLEATAAREATPMPGGLPSIAVLPFTTMSGDPEQEFFADGLVEDIITALSKLAGLSVIARNSSFVYKGQAVDVREVARHLGVRYVLEGSVRRGGNRLRITAQLVDASTGAHVWAERYDRALDDIFAVQDEITLVVATEMQVKLTEGEQARLRHRATDSIEAWTHWVEGLAHFRTSVTDQCFGAALACWQKALALDPNSATLNAMIGFLHYADSRFGWWDDRASADAKAQAFADRAMAIDPENSDANVTASCAMLAAGRYEEAVEFVRRAVRLAPGSADSRNIACFILASSGHADEAVVHGERSLALSPNYPGYFIGTLGNAYRLAGRFDEAEAAFRAYHARSPGFGLVDLVLIYEQTGRTTEASRLARELLAIRRDFTISGWAASQFRADEAAVQQEIAQLRAVGLPMG